MNPNKALWEKGDFTCLAQSMRRSGESLVNGLGITKALKVLDLGCGDGTTALPEATLCCMVGSISSTPTVLSVKFRGNPGVFPRP